MEKSIDSCDLLENIGESYKPNKDAPPLHIKWVDDYYDKIPQCPMCEMIVNSLDQCESCGQRFLPDAIVRERRKVFRLSCPRCGGKDTMVCLQVEYNGHLRGTCAACGAIVMS